MRLISGAIKGNPNDRSGQTGSALVEHKISDSPPKTRHLRVNE